MDALLPAEVTALRSVTLRRPWIIWCVPITVSLLLIAAFRVLDAVVHLTCQCFPWIHSWVLLLCCAGFAVATVPLFRCSAIPSHPSMPFFYAGA